MRARKLGVALLVAAACTAQRDRVRSGEAWADAAPRVYPAEPEELRTALSKMLALWEFGYKPEASDPAVLNVYDRGEPVAPESLVGRVRIEPGPGPGQTRVTAIGARARGFSWDYRYRVDERIHEKLGTLFHG